MRFDCTLAPYGGWPEQVSLTVKRRRTRQSMARSLKTSYLLLALGVSAVLALILGGLAYYEHRVTTSDANQLTYATVEQKLEADLQARARSLSNITSTSLAPALKQGNIAAVAATPPRLLDKPAIAQVEVWGPPT